LRRLQLPDGFKIEKFARGLGAPRMLVVADILPQEIGF